MANLHIAQRKLDDAKQVANKIIDQAVLCGNRLWVVLGNLALMKVKTLQNHYIGVAESLDSLIGMVDNFDESLCQFMRTAALLNAAISEEARLANKSKSSIAMKAIK